MGRGSLDSLPLMICDTSSYTTIFLHAHLKGSTSILSHLEQGPAVGMHNRGLPTLVRLLLACPGTVAKGILATKRWRL
jgi:hypothetical protein